MRVFVLYSERGDCIMNIEFENMDEFSIDIDKPSKPYCMPIKHYHNCYEIYIILSGSRIMAIDDESFCGESGDVFLISPGKIHHTSGMKYERAVIYFSEKFINDYFSENFKSVLLDCFKTNGIKMQYFIKNIEDVCDEFAQLIKSNKKAEIAVKLAGLLLMLINNMNKPVENREEKNVGYMVADIVDFIGENYSWLENIGEIAEKFFISREYLCKIFKKQTGVTVISYLNTLKLEKAQQLLTSSNKRISEIVALCGYSSSTYFGKLFAEKYGMSPREYRKSFKEGSIKLTTPSIENLDE